jgi:gluconolactonase
MELSRRAMLGATAAAAIAPAARAQEKYPVVGKVEHLDPACAALIDADAVVEKVTDGYIWSEGPVWVGGPKGFVLVSDPRTNFIHRWNETDGDSVWLKPSGYGGGVTPTLSEPGTNGLFLGRGGIVAADSGNRGICRIDLKTKYKTMLCRDFEGKRFNSPNDLVVGKDGAIYFTDPPYGLTKGLKSPFREMDYTGVFRLSTDNVVTLIDKTVSPNGIGLSPDNRTLYTTDRTGWVAWTLDEKGAPIDRKLFVDRAATGIMGGDSLKVDAAGNMWASSRDGISIFAPDGRRLGIVRITGSVVSNCEIGADGHLYMSCDDWLVRVKVKAKKLGAKTT